MKRFVLALAAAAVQPSFLYERPVQVTQSAAHETCVALPPDLLSHADVYLRDLRVYSGDHEVPFLAYISSTLAVDEAKPQRILNLGERNGMVTFDVEMTEPRYSRVMLHIARPRFSVLAHVSGIERPGQRGVAFPAVALSANGSDDEPQQREITVPLSSFRYLHFDIQTLALDPVQPADITGVDVMAKTNTLAQYVPAAVASIPVPKDHATVYTFQLPPNVAADRLTFSSYNPRAVFSRSADVERFAVTQPDAQTPRQSEGVRLEQDGKRDSTHSVTLGLGAAPYASAFRLTIQNGDDAPLTLRGVMLEMLERRVCFLPQPGAAYVFRYGDPALAAPRYDLSPIEAALPGASVSTLGPERALAAAADAGVPFTERHRALLWMALLLAVGSLGYAALCSARGR